MRRWTGAALALVIGLNGALVVPAPVALAAPAATTPSELVTWLNGLLALSAEAGEGNTVFESWSQAAPKFRNREDFEAFALTQRPIFEGTQARLRNVKARLAAYPEYVGSPEDARMARTLLRDMRGYADRIEGAVDVVNQLLGAVIAKDEPRVQSLIVEVRDVTALLIEGQVVMVKGRQSLYSRQDTGYYVLGAMTSLYEGMAAILYAAFASQTPEQAATTLRAAAERCRQFVAAGRPVHEQALRAAPPAERALYAMDGETLAIAAEIAEALDSGAALIEAGGERSVVFRTALGPLVALENRYIAVTTRQSAMATGGAGKTGS